MRKETILEQQGENEFLLKGQNVWVTVGNVSVFIGKGDEGVRVDLYPLECEEADNPTVSTLLSYQEALNHVENSNEDGSLDYLVRLHKQRMEQAAVESHGNSPDHS